MSMTRRLRLRALLHPVCEGRGHIAPAATGAQTGASRLLCFTPFPSRPHLSASSRTAPPPPNLKSSVNQEIPPASLSIKSRVEQEISSASLSNKTSVEKKPTSPSQEVVTVFSELVQRMVPHDLTRKSLFDLKRSLNAAQHPSDIAAAFSRHSALLLNRESWMVFLDILQRGSNPALAIQVFDWKMAQPNTVFTPQEYALIMRLAGKLGMLEKVRTLYYGMPSRGVCRTIEVENAYMYAHAYDSGKNDCVEALNVFRRLQNTSDCRVKPNLTSYNIALSCYSKLRHLQHLEETFDELVGAGCCPSVETYNCLMLAYQRLGFWWRMEELFCMMQSATLQPNRLTFRILVRGYAAAGLLDRMEKAQEAMLNCGYCLRASTAEAVIAAYRKAGDLAKMEKILFSMKARGRQRKMSKLILQSHACNGQIESIESMVDDLMRKGDVPFSPRLAVIIVKAYFKHGEHDRIKNFVKAAQDSQWHLNRSFFNTLIYLYAKHERYNDMKKYFQGMLVFSRCQPNFRTFQIMQRAYLKAHMNEEAQEVMSGMRAMGITEV